MKTKIVLSKDVANLGKSGDIVTVARGYAQNLISQNFASIADKGAIQNLRARESSAKYAEQVEREESKKIFSLINDREVKFEVCAGDNGKLHESITSLKISEALNNQFSVSVPKNKIRIGGTDSTPENRIYSFGVHDVSVNLFPEIVANIKVNVLQKNI